MKSIHVSCWRCGSKYMRKRGACPECKAVIDESRTHWEYVQALEKGLDFVRRMAMKQGSD